MKPRLLLLLLALLAFGCAARPRHLTVGAQTIHHALTGDATNVGAVVGATWDFP